MYKFENPPEVVGEKEMGDILGRWLGRWLGRGYTIAPKFEGTFRVTVEPCKCRILRRVLDRASCPSGEMS